MNMHEFLFNSIDEVALGKGFTYEGKNLILSEMGSKNSKVASLPNTDDSHYLEVKGIL